MLLRVYKIQLEISKNLKNEAKKCSKEHNCSEIQYWTDHVLGCFCELGKCSNDNHKLENSDESYGFHNWL